MEGLGATLPDTQRLEQDVPVKGSDVAIDEGKFAITKAFVELEDPFVQSFDERIATALEVRSLFEPSESLTPEALPAKR